MLRIGYCLEENIGYCLEENICIWNIQQILKTQQWKTIQLKRSEDTSPYDSK